LWHIPVIPALGKLGLQSRIINQPGLPSKPLFKTKLAQIGAMELMYNISLIRIVIMNPLLYYEYIVIKRIKNK
jgi:hypothetical protein